MCRSTSDPFGPRRCPGDGTGAGNRKRARAHQRRVTELRAWAMSADRDEVETKLSETSPVTYRRVLERELERRDREAARQAAQQTTTSQDTAEPTGRKPTTRQIEAARKRVAKAETDLRRRSMGTTNPATVAAAQEKVDAERARLDSLLSRAEQPDADQPTDADQPVTDTEQPGGETTSEQDIQTSLSAEQEADQPNTEHPRAEFGEPTDADRQAVADVVAGLRAQGKDDVEIAQLIRESLTRPGGTPSLNAAMREQMTALIRAEGARRKADEEARAVQPPTEQATEPQTEPEQVADKKPKPRTRKQKGSVPTSAPAESYDQLVERLERARQEQDQRSAAWAALTEQERATRLAAHQQQIARDEEAARRRSAERRAARLAAMSEQERAAFEAKEAEDARRWEAMLDAQRARAAEQPSTGWDEDEDAERYAAPTIPVDSGAALRQQATGQQSVVAYTDPVQRVDAPPQAVQQTIEQQVQMSQPNRFAAGLEKLRQQAAAQSNPWERLRAERDAAIRASRAAEVPLATPQQVAQAEAFDAARLDAGEVIRERIRTERLVQDAAERTRAEAYARSEQGRANPFTVLVKPRKRVSAEKLALFDPTKPIPQSGHKIPASSGLPFGGRIIGKLDLGTMNAQVNKEMGGN